MTENCDINEPRNRTKYAYDEFNRLTGTSNASGPFYTYTYDRWGNRTAQTPSQGGVTFNQPFNTANNRVSGTGFTYDAAGNLTSDGTNNYTYDADGNVTQQGTLIYDALNHQVGQSFSSGSLIGSALAYDKDGNVASLWLVSTGNVLNASATIGKAYWNGTPFETYNSSSAFFEHRDWVGSRRAATNTAKTVTVLRTSLPFGDGASNVSGSRDNTFDGYAGLWDSGAVSNHAQFRDYWNVAGRWLQPDPYSGSYDPSNPQSFNRYAYVLNNPERFIDPLGLDGCDDVELTTLDDDGNPTSIGVSTTCIVDGGGSGGFDCSQLPGGCLGPNGPNNPPNPGGPVGNAPNNPKPTIPQLRKAICANFKTSIEADDKATRLFAGVAGIAGLSALFTGGLDAPIAAPVAIASGGYAGVLQLDGFLQQTTGNLLFGCKN